MAAVGSAGSAVEPVPLLLQGQDYAYRSATTGLDFQERMFAADLVADAPGDPVPCVLVLARAADMEMNALSLALAEHDVRMVRIDADRCLDLALTVYHDAPLLELGRWLLRPILVWERHFDLTALPVDPTTAHGAYVREQWAAVSGWLTSRADWEHINPTRGLDRMTQLRDARAFGLPVPRSVVTTMPGRSRPGGGRCVVKTAGRHLLEPRPGALRGLFPRPLDVRRSGAGREPAPVLVQEHLDAEHELRVFAVDDRLIAYRVRKLDPAQLWVDPEAVTVEPVEVPDALAAKLRALRRHWRLHVAAFDLLRVADDWYFLEVNVNCDWRWFEERAGGTEVSDAVHRSVRERFAAATATTGW
ncbi:ATP-grasp domain-containing protein [Saccharopolyspora sp. CA-218241]|uniref:ATP-grasp domain-containing protein n=1 Tax=Saccharopolyspora sp. CA-218241 TaxID=3240027 RepID=UPI003D991B4C